MTLKEKLAELYMDNFIMAADLEAYTNPALVKLALAFTVCEAWIINIILRSSKRYHGID